MRWRHAPMPGPSSGLGAKGSVLCLFTIGGQCMATVTLCAHSMSSFLLKPPSIKCCFGSVPKIASTFSSIGRARPRSELLVETSTANHDLLAGNARNLHVVGRSKPTISHLHH